MLWKAISIFYFSFIYVFIFFLAAKFEDKDLDVPGIAILNAFADNQYNASMFKFMEISILKFFNWNIGM